MGSSGRCRTCVGVRPREGGPMTEPAAEESAEEPAAEMSAEEPTAEVSAEEPAAEMSAEEPTAEVSAEEPAAEVSAEEPTAEVSAEEPAAEVSAEEPAAEVPAEEPAAEQPVEELSAEEPAAEVPAEEPPAAQKNRIEVIGTGIAASAALKSLPKSRSWKTRAGLGAAAVVVGLGVVAAVLALVGRPSVSVSSGEQLVQVHLGGFGTHVTGVRAASSGRPVALAPQSSGFVPVAALSQGRTVQVRVTAAPPSWLHWLLGSGVSTSATARAPSAAPTARVAVAAHPGRVTLGFNRPVSVVDYKAAGGTERVIRLRRPSTTAELAVPDNQSGGALQVTAAAWPWERLAASPATVDWLQAPKDGVPVAAAVPAPGSSDQGLDSPITLTFDEPVTKALGSTRPRVSPHTAGTWTEPNADTLVFTPRGLGFGPGTAVSVSFDHRVAVVGGSSTSSVALAASGSYHFAVTQVSVLRLQQILAQLHYLPLNFTPAPGVHEPTTLAGEVAALGSPLKGRFSWRWQSTPAVLKSKWQPGSPTVIVKGALMAFMSAADSSAYNGYTADAATVSQLANALWKPLLRA